MATAGACTDAALTAGLGGGTGRTDTHMLVAGRAGAHGVLLTSGRAALAFRSAQLRTAVRALRYGKSTLQRVAPVESAFAPMPLDDPLADDGFTLEDAPELSDEELELLEREADEFKQNNYDRRGGIDALGLLAEPGGVDDDLWQPQLSDLDAF